MPGCTSQERGSPRTQASASSPEVTNPSEIFLSGSEENFSGVAIAATLEGMRPLLVETQALVTPQAYGTPQRSATGFDLRRLNMLLAVLEARCGVSFASTEVYLNVAEFDAGVFGAEAAARHYFGVSAADLSAVQAARLAAILPDPKGRSASQPSRFVRNRAASILDGAATIRADGRADCF